MKHLTELLPEVKKGKNKVEFEFQDICLSLMELFGKDKVTRNRIWSLPSQKWWTNEKGRDSLKMLQNSKVQTLDYYIGIVKKLT